MKRNFSSPGIILRVRPGKDKNRYISIITPGMGIIGATAYGASGQKSSLRASTQTFHTGEIFFYKDPVKNYTKIVDIDVIREFTTLRNDPGKIYAASLLTEVMLKAYWGNDQDPRAYRLMFEYLEALDTLAGGEEVLLASASLWRYLEIIGEQPELDFDVRRSAQIPAAHRSVYLFHEKGFTSSFSPGEGIVMDGTQRSFLEFCTSASLRDSAEFARNTIGLSNGQMIGIFRLLTGIYEYGMGRKLKSLESGLFP